jgi:putative DNA primase/helicase
LTTELSRLVTDEGIFYTYNGKRAGPFTANQEELVEFDMKVLPQALGVSAKELLVFRVNQAPPVSERAWSLTLDKKTKPDQVAEMLLELHEIATFMDTGEVLVYRDGLYVKGAETFLAAEIEREAREQDQQQLITSSFVREAIDHVRRRTYRDRKQFDTDPRILNLQNGLLNVETLKFEPHTPEYFSVNQLPVKYDAKADCPKIKAFLSQVAFPEDLAALQEVAGYTLWKEYSAHVAVMLVGDGANGKSTFINVLKSLLGLDNIASRSLQDLVMNRFAGADLYGKSANLYADLSDQALKFTGMFKMLTGNDPVTAEQKFRNPFVFTNYAKLIFSANKVPEVYEDRLAFFRRWILFTFPNTFTGTKENRNLLKDLTTPEELSGFLAWSLEGLQRLRQNNWKFSN